MLLEYAELQLKSEESTIMDYLEIKPFPHCSIIFDCGLHFLKFLKKETCCDFTQIDTLLISRRHAFFGTRKEKKFACDQ